MKFKIHVAGMKDLIAAVSALAFSKDDQRVFDELLRDTERVVKKFERLDREIPPVKVK